MHGFPKQMQETKTKNTFLGLLFCKVFYYTNRKQNVFENFLAKFYEREDM